jgi:hypothetical protein
MPRGILRALCGLVLLFVPLFAQAADTPDTTLSPLKFLVGEWKGADAEGKAHKIAFALSSGGTSLTETLTPPDSPPMTTMYYSDGDQLMLTHYCSLNNQPRMRAAAIKEGDKSDHLCLCGCHESQKPDRCAHAPARTIDVKDHDHFTQTWTLSKAGKDVPKVFSFERVK